MTTPATTTPTPAVAFAETATPAVGEEWVVRKGLIFRAGSYPDKSFEMTPEELTAAATDFQGVPIGVSHVASVFDGKLGTCFEVEARGDALYGTTRLPRWLDTLLADGERKVSCYWDRATKRLKKLDLVPNPRIEDAILFAEFAAHGLDVNAQPAETKPEPEPTPEPAPEPEDPPAEFAARKQSEDANLLMQAVHDRLARFDPDVCDPSWAPAGFSADPAAFADWPKQVKAMKAMHTLTVDHGAKCPGAAAMSANPSTIPSITTPVPVPKGEPMSRRDDLLKALFGDAKLPEGVELKLNDQQASAAFAAIQPPKPEPDAAFHDSPAAKAMRAEIEELKRRDRERAERARQQRTLDFGREALKKFPSHQARGLTVAFAQAVEDDDQNSVSVAFSRGKETVTGGRADALEAWLDGLPDSVFTREVIGGGGPLPRDVDVLFNRADDDPSKVSENRINQLLSQTPTGRAALAAMGKNGSGTP